MVPWPKGDFLCCLSPFSGAQHHGALYICVFEPTLTFPYYILKYRRKVTFVHDQRVLHGYWDRCGRPWSCMKATKWQSEDQRIRGILSVIAIFLGHAIMYLYQMDTNTLRESWRRIVWSAALGVSWQSHVSINLVEVPDRMYYENTCYIVYRHGPLAFRFLFGHFQPAMRPSVPVSLFIRSALTMDKD